MYYKVKQQIVEIHQLRLRLGCWWAVAVFPKIIGYGTLGWEGVGFWNIKQLCDTTQGGKEERKGEKVNN